MKKRDSILLSIIASGIILTGCGGGGSSSDSNYVDPHTKTYSLEGVAYDGPLYNSKVTVYDKDNNIIAQTIIENEDGSYSFKDLKTKPAFVKVEDGIDLGLDGKKGGGDDTFFEDILYSKVKGDKVNVTPLTTLEYFANKDLNIGEGYTGEDLKHIIAVRNVVKIVKTAGLSPEEAYETLSKSISENEEFIIDGTKLEENLKQYGVSLNIVKDIVENLKDIITNLPEDLSIEKLDKDTKADIYSMETAINAIKNTLEVKPISKEEMDEIEEELPTLLDPNALNNIKEALLQTQEEVKDEDKEVDIGEFAKALSNTITENPESIKDVLYSAPPKVPTTCSSNLPSVRSFEKTTRSGSVQVTCGPNPETIKMWFDCDNDGVVIKNVCSTTGNLCKICCNGMIKEIKLQRRYLRVKETGTPTLDQKFNAVKDYLKNILSFEFIDFGSSLSINNGEKKSYILTMVLRRIDKCSCKAQGYITASVLINASKNANDYTFKIPANSKLFITSKTGKMGQLVITKKLSTDKEISCQNGKIKINVADYIDKIVNYAGNSSYAKDAKEMIYEYTTKPGLFDVYFILNETTADGGTGTNNKDFIKNPYLFDATKYQLDLNPYNQTFTNKEHAFKVTIGLN